MDLLETTDSSQVVFASRDTTGNQSLAGSPGWPIDGNPAIPTNPTQIPAYHYCLLMGEQYNLLLASGITPDGSNYTQVYQAVLSLRYMLDTGSANALAAAPKSALLTGLPALSSIPDGFEVQVNPAHTTTTTTPTFAFNGGSAITITDPLGNALRAGDIVAGKPARLMKAGGASPTWWLLNQQAPTVGAVFNVQQFTTSTRVSMSGTSGNSYTVTPWSPGSYVKQSATSTLLVWLSAPSFTPTSPGTGAATVKLNIGSANYTWLAANNTAATSVGESGGPIAITGLAAGSQAITLQYIYNTPWTTIFCPNSSDESYYPQTEAELIIEELGP